MRVVNFFYFFLEKNESDFFGKKMRVMTISYKHPLWGGVFNFNLMENNMEVTIVALNSEKLTAVVVVKNDKLHEHFMGEQFFWVRFKNQTAMGKYKLQQKLNLDEQLLNEIRGTD